MEYIFMVLHKEVNKIEAIKALRNCTGIGLKDAKDAVEDMIWNNKAFVSFLRPEIKSDTYYQQEFRNAHTYFSITEKKVVESKYKVRLNSLIVDAVKSEDFNLVNDLIPIYRKHFGV